MENKLAPEQKPVSTTTAAGHGEALGEITLPESSAEQVYAAAQVGISAGLSFIVESSVNEHGSFSEAARNEIKTSIRNFVRDLERKIQEVAEDEKAHGAKDIEVTASTVIKANSKLRESLSSSRTRARDVAVGLAIPICAGAAGILGGDITHSALQAVLFGATAATAIFATAMSLLRGR